MLSFCDPQQFFRQQEEDSHGRSAFWVESGSHVVVLLPLVLQESNGPSDAYAAISSADRLQNEPESLRKWREEQRERLELLGEERPGLGRLGRLLPLAWEHSGGEGGGVAPACLQSGVDCFLRVLLSLHRQQLSLAGVRVEGEGQGGAGGVALQAERAAGENQDQQQVAQPAGAPARSRDVFRRTVMAPSMDAPGPRFTQPVDREHFCICYRCPWRSKYSTPVPLPIPATGIGIATDLIIATSKTNSRSQIFASFSFD